MFEYSITERHKMNKFNQLELEILALSHLKSNVKTYDKFNEKSITNKHFYSLDAESNKSFVRAIYNMICSYYKKNDVSSYTDFVFQHKLNSSGISESDRAKFVLLWSEINDCDVNSDDLPQIIEELKKRQALRLIKQMMDDASENLVNKSIDDTYKSITEAVEQLDNELNDRGGEAHTLDISDSSEYFEIEYTKRIQNPELYKGITCGIKELDSKTFGFLPGQIVVFLAPSSGGKSVFMLNAALHANEVAKKNVLYMSFEMNSWLCLLRHISLKFEIPYAQVKDQQLDAAELKKVLNGLKAMKDGPYFEYDVNMEDPTPEYIDSRIKELIKTKGKPDLLVVDYIGNMTVRNAPNGSKDWENQTKAVNELFKMAKRYAIPIITAQQINRETIRDARKQKENKKFMSYDQAAASGGQALLHLCTYAVAIEPNREKNYCILHPVKMRDAYFFPFPIALDPEYNKIREMDEREKETIMAFHDLSNGQKTDKPSAEIKSINTIGNIKTEDEDEDFTPLDTSSIIDTIDLGGWKL
jgi:replicative DNA helicase